MDKFIATPNVWLSGGVYAIQMVTVPILVSDRRRAALSPVRFIGWLGSSSVFTPNPRWHVTGVGRILYEQLIGRGWGRWSFTFLRFIDGAKLRGEFMEVRDVLNDGHAWQDDSCRSIGNVGRDNAN